MAPIKPTKYNKNRHPKRGKRSELSDRQRLAVLEIVKGATDEEAAKACGVTRSTVNEWRNRDALFIRALNVERNKLRHKTMKLFRKRMAEMTGAALDEIRAAISKGDTATAKWLLESIEINAIAKNVFEQEANPALCPEDMGTILDEVAASRVDEFLREEMVVPMERLRLQSTLRRKELERLRKEYGKDCDAKE